jgi:hypothetical protein
MRRLCLGVFLVALASLALEIMVTRLFETILIRNMAYFIVTAAVFAFGLAGIVASLRPLPTDEKLNSRLALVAACLGIAICILAPVVDVLSLDYFEILRAPVKIIASYLVLYIVVLLPFFLTGYLLILIFSKYANRIQELYFWDLCGAGIGTLLIIPFVPLIGPTGLIMCAGALAFFAAALFSDAIQIRAVSIAAGLAAMAVPIAYYPNYLEVENKIDKRNVMEMADAGDLELTEWDPISKIQVFDMKWSPEKARRSWRSGDKKQISYDGGNQSSYYYPFDGDFSALRARIDRDKSDIHEHFWHLSVLASHYVKRDTGQTVLIIGSAGGQETKAAVTYGASRVQAVELVSAVVKLGTGAYSAYIGNVFKHPSVTVQAGEGRSFLRQSKERFGIIQSFSVYTSSSIGQGAGALSPAYLQTAEAYEEYFSHLKPDGILQINHHYYPRMITTAAKAWKDMGRTDFQRHVAVFVSPAHMSLPAVLIKMTPWTKNEIAELQEFLRPPERDLEMTYTLVENPVETEKSFLSQEFYSGRFPDSLDAKIPINLSPVTDDVPFFSNIRKRLAKVAPDPDSFVDQATAGLLNRQLKRGVIPMDKIFLYLVTALSIVFVLLFVFVPLRFSAVGRQQGARITPLLVYFSCLGAGFIIIELIYIQQFMRLIGSPLYTYSTVIFTMLVAAGIGSLSSMRLGVDPARRWQVPFAAVIALGVATLGLQDWLFHFGLAFGVVGRALFAAVLIFPIGFFLGMCLPLGVLAIERRPQGAIAWAWGMNGVFTVAGGVASVYLSFALGFANTLLIAIALYAVAFLVFPVMRDGTGKGVDSPVSSH